jgi:hypothetical protein
MATRAPNPAAHAIRRRERSDARRFARHEEMARLDGEIAGSRSEQCQPVDLQQRRAGLEPEPAAVVLARGIGAQLLVDRHDVDAVLVLVECMERERLLACASSAA